MQQAEEYFLNKRTTKNGTKTIGHWQTSYCFERWGSRQDQQTLEKELADSFNGEVYCSFNEPTLEELTANQVPVKLQNASFIKPFEMLTEMYSLPKYDEIDPQRLDDTFLLCLLWDDGC